MDINYFHNIDSEKKAYWLGFIVADGNISKTTNRISITLNSDDDYILEDLKNELKCENKIRRYLVFDKRTNKYNKSSVFQFSSKQLKEDLKLNGIDENKSSNFDFDLISKTKYFQHFLRGLFDGDGFISGNKSRIMLISTKQFLSFINNKMFSSKYMLQNITNNVYRLYVQNHWTCVDFLNYLYDNSSIFLKRKYERYLNLLKNNPVNVCRNRKLEVIDVDNNLKIFNSIKEFCENYNTDSGTIINLIKKNKTYKNMKLRRLEFEKVVKPIAYKSDFNLKELG
jgi:hypothetical protein